MTDDIITIEEARRRKAAQGAGLDGDIIMPGAPAAADRPVEESKDDTIARLCRLGPIEYDLVRVAEAEALGIRTSTLITASFGMPCNGFLVSSRLCCYWSPWCFLWSGWRRAGHSIQKKPCHRRSRQI